MKSYAYYPGCSLEKMARSYHVSTLAVARALDIELQELEDWNCCGATAYFHVDEILAYTLCARNLAMAEEAGFDTVIAPCSGCYKNMYFTAINLRGDPDLAEHINFALEADNLHYEGRAIARHFLNVLCEDIGIDAIRERVTHPLNGLKVAAYYGCQIVRPRKANEDVELPMYYEQLMEALGAEPVPYDLKLRCCGGSLVATHRRAALGMLGNLLQNAEQRGAQVIATACPLCQINLECYQGHVNQELGTKFSMPVVFFTQLVGLALGIPPKQLGFGKELVSTKEIVAYARRRTPAPAAS